jgi:HJR/Mrr/RecB family endonuclease
MSPTNFEHLLRQLFEAQGAEGWTTTQSNDDGVDAGNRLIWLTKDYLGKDVLIG